MQKLMAFQRLLFLLFVYSVSCLEYEEVASMTDSEDSHVRKERQFSNTANLLTPFQLRLVNGSTPNQGRVEVQYNGEWGTVCVQPVNANYIYVARVVCRQLGYPDAVEAKIKSFYGRGEGKVWLRPNCYGDEPLLEKCKYSWWQNLRDDCLSHDNDLGVVCSNATIVNLRLVGGPKPSEGRVEIFYNGEWGTVCGRDADIYVGVVVCRQLGYREVLRVSSISSMYGTGTGTIWMTPGKGCSKRVTRPKLLPDCLRRGYRWGRTGCDHSEDLSVVCSKDVPVRLANGSSPSEGRIEVLHEGVWGTVCNNARDVDMGQVICRQLGYGGLDRIVLYPDRFGQGKGPVWLSPNCIGNETHLGHCSFFKWGVYDFWCDHSHDAGVICANTTILRTPAPLIIDESCIEQPIALGIIIPLILICVAIAVIATFISILYLCKLKESANGFTSSKFENEPNLQVEVDDRYEKDLAGLSELPDPGIERLS